MSGLLTTQSNVYQYSRTRQGNRIVGLLNGFVYQWLAGKAVLRVLGALCGFLDRCLKSTAVDIDGA